MLGEKQNCEKRVSKTKILEDYSRIPIEYQQTNSIGDKPL